MPVAEPSPGLSVSEGGDCVFVALKLMALAAGFTFYCFALLALIFISFAGAVYESVKYLNARTTGLKSA